MLKTTNGCKRRSEKTEANLEDIEADSTVRNYPVFHVRGLHLNSTIEAPSLSALFDESSKESETNDALPFDVQIDRARSQCPHLERELDRCLRDSAQVRPRLGIARRLAVFAPGRQSFLSVSYCRMIVAGYPATTE